MKWVGLLNILWISACLAAPSHHFPESSSVAIDILNSDQQPVETWNWTGNLKCRPKDKTLHISFSDTLKKYPYALTARISDKEIHVELIDSIGNKWTMDKPEPQGSPTPWLGSSCKAFRVGNTIELVCEKLRESRREFSGLLNFQVKLDCPKLKK